MSALTVTCPHCGSTQSFVCRGHDGRIRPPHRARFDALDQVRNNTDSVYLLLGSTAVSLTPGDLLVGRTHFADKKLIAVSRRLTDGLTVNAVISSQEAVWVGWEMDFSPDLFDVREALEAQKSLRERSRRPRRGSARA